MGQTVQIQSKNRMGIMTTVVATIVVLFCLVVALQYQSNDANTINSSSSGTMTNKQTDKTSMKQQQQRDTDHKNQQQRQRQRQEQQQTDERDDSSIIIEQFLYEMTLVDKIGQMSQIDISLLLENDDTDNKVGVKLSDHLVHHYIGVQGIGSVMNYVPHGAANKWDASDYRRAMIQIQEVAKQYGRPPVLWSMTSIHGANYMLGALLTPQPINLAATFNETCAYLAGKLASRDTRAAGIQWLNAPLLGIAVEPRWSRYYETFGEDPHVVGTMAQHMINGIQEYNEDENVAAEEEIPSRAAACAKHFVGYSDPHDGHDRSPSWIPTRHLYQYFLVPWNFIMNRGGNMDRFDDDDDDDNNNVNDDNYDSQYDFKDNPKRYNNNQKHNIPLTIMESYTEYDGVPNVVNTQSLEFILRRQLQYNGVIVSSYDEIENLNQWHHVTNNYADSIIATLTKGDTIDIANIPELKDYEEFRRMILEGFNTSNIHEKQNNLQQNHHPIQQSRIDRSVKRILQLKASLNMFHETITMDNNIHTKDFNHGDDSNYDPEDVKMVLDLAHQSFVLVENKNNILPLEFDEESTQTILVTGPTADRLSYQSGGFTGVWEGATNIGGSSKQHKHAAGGGWFNHNVSFTIADYLLQKMENKNETNINVIYTCGVNILGGDCTDDNDDAPDNSFGDNAASITEAEDIVKKHKNKIDLIIICVGEEPYAEKPGDITDLALPVGQNRLVRNLEKKVRSEHKRNDVKIILVYLGGRPRLLHEMKDHVDAILVGFLPGPSAGQAFYDIITGRVNPSGRLPVSYPYDDGGSNAGIPYYHTISDECTHTNQNVSRGEGVLPHFIYVPCNVMWPFGHGLSYTTFTYSNLRINTNALTYYYNHNHEHHSKPHDEGILSVSVTISNTGSYDGSETVMFYTFDRSRSVTPEYKRLRYYKKVFVPVGSFESVTMNLRVEDLKFVGPDDDRHYVLQDGLQFQVGVGATTDCRQGNQGSTNEMENNNDMCSEFITIQTKNYPTDNDSNNDEDNDNNHYIPACEAACTIWSKSGCIVDDSDTATSTLRPSEDIKLMPTRSYCYDLCASVSTETYIEYDRDQSVDSSIMMEQSPNGWGWNYVHCIESVFWGFQHKQEELLYFNNNGYETHLPNNNRDDKQHCLQLTTLCRNVFVTDGLDEFGNHVIGQSRTISAVAFRGTKIFTILILFLAFAIILFWYFVIRNQRLNDFFDRRQRGHFDNVATSADYGDGDVQFGTVKHSNKVYEYGDQI